MCNVCSNKPCIFKWIAPQLMTSTEKISAPVLQKSLPHKLGQQSNVKSSLSFMLTLTQRDPVWQVNPSDCLRRQHWLNVIYGRPPLLPCAANLQAPSYQGDNRFKGGRGRVDDYINLNICFGLVPSWFNRGRAKCTQTVFGWRSVGVFFHDQVYGSDYLSGGLFLRLWCTWGKGPKWL